MNEKKDIQSIYIAAFKHLQIDYLHLTNRGLRQGTLHTTAFAKPVACVLNWPDLTFCLNKKVYMRELGLPGSHMGRKIKQEERMRFWCLNGGVSGLVITSPIAAKADLSQITGLSIPEIGEIWRKAKK